MIKFQVCKLLRHIATTESLQVASKYSEINLRIYGPQVVTAAQTLCLYPTSKIAKENVEGNILKFNFLRQVLSVSQHSNQNVFASFTIFIIGSLFIFLFILLLITMNIYTYVCKIHVNIRLYILKILQLLEFFHIL